MLQRITVIILIIACGCASAPARKQTHISAMLEGESITVRGAMADPDAVVALVRSARFVFLGELHDNPRHHVLQAEMLRALIEAGRAPAVAFEMLDVDQTLAIRQARDPKTFGDAVSWEKRGWPSYAMYEPIVALAMQRGLPIVATNLEGAALMTAVKKGESAQSLGFTRTIDDTARAAMADDIRKGHCGHASDAMTKAMVAAQELRDAYLAQRVLQSSTASGAVLIAGGEHARRDRGAAFHAAGAPGVDPASVVSVGFIEGDEPVAEGAFDIVWRTPPMQREDPCVEFEAKLKSMNP